MTSLLKRLRAHLNRKRIQKLSAERHRALRQLDTLNIRLTLYLAGEHECDQLLLLHKQIALIDHALKQFREYA